MSTDALIFVFSMQLWLLRCEGSYCVGDSGHFMQGGLFHKVLEVPTTMSAVHLTSELHRCVQAER